MGKTATVYQQKRLDYLWLVFRPWFPGLTCNSSQHTWHSYCKHCFRRKNSFRPLVLAATWMKLFSFNYTHSLMALAAIALHSFRLMLVALTCTLFIRCVRTSYLHLNPWWHSLLPARLMQMYNRWWWWWWQANRETCRHRYTKGVLCPPPKDVAILQTRGDPFTFL